MREVVKKVVVVGDASCGKTSILHQMCKSIFPSLYKPTILDNFSITLNHGPLEVTLTIWDTSGTEEWNHLRKLTYYEADIVIITFDVSNRYSLENALFKWDPEVTEFCKKVPKVLVANKVDLRNSSRKTMSIDRGRSAAKLIKAKYVECSALTSFGINDLVETLKNVLFPSSKSFFCTII